MTEFCYTLAAGVASTLLTELEDTSKATFEYLSAAGGKYSQAVIDRSEEMATLGMRANNDPSEGMFATFTDILCSGGRISLSSASAIGQMRYNKDMVRCHERFVTGKRLSLIITIPLNWVHSIFCHWSCRIHCCQFARRVLVVLEKSLMRHFNARELAEQKRQS